jgi:hypothetical protein
MLFVCLLFTTIAAGFTYFYNFNEPLCYAELIGYIQKGTASNKDEEKDSDSKKPILEK